MEGRFPQRVVELKKMRTREAIEPFYVFPYERVYDDLARVRGSAYFKSHESSSRS